MSEAATDGAPRTRFHGATDGAAPTADDLAERAAGSASEQAQ